jgi:hypothetical protein
MKKLFLLFLLSVGAIQAVDLTVSWDFNTDDTTGYKLYQSPNIGLTNSTLIGVTASNKLVITYATPTNVWLYVTATNTFLESDKSDPIKIVLSKPNKPLKMTVTFN